MTTRIARLACLALLLAAAGSLAGCGYALVGTSSNLPPEVQKIYLNPLENATRRSEVEQILTRSLSEELVTRKRFTLVNEAGDADATLSGKVMGFDATPLTFDAEGRATEYQITILASMTFKDKADKVIWSNDRYIYKETYPVDPSQDTYFDREKLAIEQAAPRFARTVVIDLLEGF